MSRTIGISRAVGFVVSFVILGLAIAIFLLWRWFQPAHFDGSQWKRDRGAATCGQMVRWKMVDDVRHNKLQLGMTPRQVEVLLGPPDLASREREHARKTLRWEYVTGEGNGVDCSTLWLTFYKDHLDDIGEGQA